VDSGGSNDREAFGSRTPPDEQEMRLARARLSQGYQGRGEGGYAGADSARDQASAGGASMGPGEGPDTLDLSPRFRPWSEPNQAATAPLRCHFLRSVGPDGKLGEALATAVPTHRCAAFGDPLPLSLRQQELVCLQRVHVSCPRYVRGTLLASESEAAPAAVETKTRFPLMTVVAILLVMAAVPVLFTGGFGLFASKGPSVASHSPAVTASSSSVASPVVSAAVSPRATPSATPTPAPSPVATPTTLPSPTAVVTPTPAPTPVPSPTWPPGATASRMDLLVPCTDQANCWVYTVRSGAQNGSGTDDTVAGIARFFGVSTASIYDLDPWAKAGIKPGDQLKIPPPTR
jgi:hypothetical protein